MSSSPLAVPSVSTPRTPKTTQPAPGVSIPSIYYESSPLKNADRAITSRLDIENSTPARDKRTDPNFLNNHLTKPPEHLWRHLADDPRILEIKSASKDSAVIYSPLSAVLTHLSQRAHEAIPLGVKRPDSHIVFLDHHHHSPTHHPYRVGDKPDILAVPGPVTNYKEVPNDKRTDYREVPHYKVVSLIECKPQRHDGRAQAASYSFQLLEARPDMPGAYVLWARPNGYQVLWSDAAGVFASRFLKWDNPEPLAAYVYSLYNPPSSHFLHDPTISLLEEPFDVVHWTIQAYLPGLEPYSNCKAIFVGAPWARRTNVWMHGSKRNKVVIKDSFVDDERRYKEDFLLKCIHEGGIYPGVVRLLGVAHPEITITTAQPVVDENKRSPARTRKRLFMGSFGVYLREAKSVKDILMAIYDIVEIHRGLIADTGPRVLHRDISGYNILMYPTHHPDTETGKSLVANPPLFIEQVLKRDKTRATTDKATALLIDFDNGAILPPGQPQAEPVPATTPVSEASKELACRTGTPMFIARSVGSATLLFEEFSAIFVKMPLLSPDAKKVYVAAYDEEVYNGYNDKEGYAHGRIVPDLDEECPPAQTKFYHRPDHDIESVFWVLFVTLLRAQPKMRTENVNMEKYWKAYDYFLNHTIQQGNDEDSRAALLKLTATKLTEIFDPSLTSLAPMLRAMAKQIRPEYAYLDPPPPRDHLHEAMRRLLLEQILKMVSDGDSIPLDAGTLRPLRPRIIPDPEPDASASQLEAKVDGVKKGSKRKSEEVQQGSKGKKSKGGYGDDGSRARHLS